MATCGAEQILTLGILIGWRADVEQALHQGGHHIFMIGQHVNALRGRPRPVDNQRNVQARARPVNIRALVAKRHTVTCGDYHYRVLQLAGLTQGVQYPGDLGIHIACCLGVAAGKGFLVAVIQRGAVEGNPGEPAVIVLRIAVQPADPLPGGLGVGLTLGGRQREVGQQCLTVQRAAEAIRREEPQLVTLLVQTGNQRRRNTRRQYAVHIARRDTVEQAEDPGIGGVTGAHMLGKVNVLIGKLRQRWHLLLKAGVVQPVNGDQQDVLTLAHVTVAQIAERILYRYRFGIALLDQAALILLRIKQAVFLKEAAGRHRIGERQVRALHGDWAVEVGVSPDIHEMRADKGHEEEGCNRFGVATTTRQAAQLLPAPGGKQHLNQQNNRHADKHQLPVTCRFVLVGVNHQFPDDRIKMQVKTGKDFAVDQ